MINQQIEKAFEEQWPKIQKVFDEKVKATALNAAKDDETMKHILTLVYEQLPFPFRIAIKKDVFINFCLKHRDRLCDDTDGNASLPGDENKTVKLEETNE